MDEKILLSLNKEEAMVFLDWLIRFNEIDRSSLFEDQAEERVMFDLESKLEKLIPEVFDKDYKEKLIIARDNLRDDIDLF